MPPLVFPQISVLNIGSTFNHTLIKTMRYVSMPPLVFPQISVFNIGRYQCNIKTELFIF